VAQLVERWTCGRQVVDSSPILGAKLRNNLGQVVHTYVPLSPSSTGQGAVMLCGWEGNRKPGGSNAVLYATSTAGPINE